MLEYTFSFLMRLLIFVENMKLGKKRFKYIQVILDKSIGKYDFILSQFPLCDVQDNHLLQLSGVFCYICLFFVVFTTTNVRLKH